MLERKDYLNKNLFHSQICSVKSLVTVFIIELKNSQPFSLIFCFVISSLIEHDNSLQSERLVQTVHVIPM